MSETRVVKVYGNFDRPKVGDVLVELANELGE